MRQALAITIRDFTFFFKTRRGYALLGLVVALWGFYFFNVLGRYNFLITRAAGMQVSAELRFPTLQDFVITPYFQLVAFSFVVLIPLLAMRTFAEERQLGTFEMLRTSPGSVWGLVWGKFLALSALVTVFACIAALFPLALSFFGTPDMGLIVAGCFAIFCIGISFSALALACGARCDRQLTAGVLGIFTLAALLLLHIPAPLVGPQARQVLELLSVYSEAAALIDGYVSLQALVYFAALTALGLLAAHALLSAETVGHSLSAARYGISSLGALGLGVGFIFVGGLIALVAPAGYGSGFATLHYGTGALLLIGFVGACLRAARRQPTGAALIFTLRVGIIVVVFTIAVRSRVFFDASDVRRYTVSPHTEAIVAAMRQTTELRYVFQGDLAADARAVRFLDALVALNPAAFVRRAVDPADYASLSTALGIFPGDIAQVVLHAGSDSERRLNVRQFSEQALSAALQRLHNPELPRVYLLEGGAGARVADTGPYGLSKFALALEGEGLAVSTLPYDAETIPPDAAALILAGPREGLNPTLAVSIASYLDQPEGKLFLLLDPLFVTPYIELLNRLGAKADESVVIDKEQVVFSEGRAGLQPHVRDFAEHPITNHLGAAKALIMNIVTAVSAVAGHPRVEEIAWVSAGSVREPDVLSLLQGRATFQEALVRYGSEQEKLPIAVAIESRLDTPRAVVVGDSDWVLNAAFDHYANRDFALNATQWLVGNSWALVERTRTEISSTVAISPQRLSWLMVGTILLAEALALLGLLRVRLRGR